MSLITVLVTGKVVAFDAHVLATGKAVSVVLRAVWAHVPTAQRLTLVLRPLLLLRALSQLLFRPREPLHQFLHLSLALPLHELSPLLAFMKAPP